MGERKIGGIEVIIKYDIVELCIAAEKKKKSHLMTLNAK